MRRRKWVLVIAVLFCMVSLTTYFGLQFSRANEKLKSVLLQKIRPFLDENSDIEKVGMDLVSLHLKGVTLTPKNRSFVIKVDDVRIGYRILNIFRYGFTPQKLTHQVVFIHPRIIFRADSLVFPNGENQLQDVNLRHALEELVPLRRIMISNAEILVENARREHTPVAEALNGWVETVPLDSAIVRLAGRVFGAKINNTRLEGKMDLVNMKPVHLDVQLQRFALTPEYQFLFPDFLRVNSGDMRGHVYYEPESGITGLYEIENAMLALREGHFSFKNMDIQCFLKQGDLTVEGTVNSFNGVPLKLSGRLENILQPEYHIRLSGSSLDINTFIRNTLPGKHPVPTGKGELNLNVSGPFQEPVITGDIKIENLDLVGAFFPHTLLEIGMKNRIVTMKGEARESAGTEISLNGEMSFSGDTILGALNMKLNSNGFPEAYAWLGNGIDRFRGEFAIESVTTGEGTKANLQGLLTLVSAGDYEESIVPVAVLENNSLNLEMTSTSGFNLKGMVKSPFGGARAYRFSYSNVPHLFMPFVPDHLRKSLQTLNIQGDLTGDDHSWQMFMKGLALSPHDTIPRFDLTMLSESSHDEEIPFQVKANYYGPAGESLPIALYGTRNVLRWKLTEGRVGEWLIARGVFPKNGDNNVDAEFSLNNMVFEDLHDIFPQSMPYTGVMNGAVSFTGEESDVNIRGDLHLRNAWFHDVGMYSGDVTFQGTPSALEYMKLDWKQNDHVLVAANCRAVAGDSLAGRITGKEIDFGEFFQALLGRDDYVSGKGSLDIQCWGTPRNPRFVGAVNIDSGHVGGFRFKNISASLEDRILGPEGISGGELEISSSVITRDDGLSIQCRGIIPHDPDTDLDVTINAEGNLLAPLPELSKWVIRSGALGEASFRLAGKINDLTLGSAQIQFEDGHIALASFIREIDALKTKITMDNENRFLHIEYLSGEIQNQPFTISNRDLPESSLALEPLALPRLGIHLGELGIKTGGRGLRIHLPGLMETGDEGWIGFQGYTNPDEPFLLMGPSDAPRFQGTLLCTDTRLTYPFLSSGDDKTEDPVMHFLGTVDWNLRIVPKRDVHYVREMASPFGNVFVDLKLQDHYGAFYVQGINDDGSLQVWGNLLSTEGSIEVLDHFFRPEEITFDYPKGAESPLLSVRAFTTIIDSTGIPATIWLTVSELDAQTGVVLNEGDWDKLNFQFSTDNPHIGRTQADLLAALGFATDRLTERAYQALGVQVDNMVFRPIIRPLERGLRKHLGLDVVRFSSMFSRNLVQLRNVNQLGFDPMMLLQSSRFMVGKYLGPGFFVTYSGEVQRDIGLQYHMHGLGFRHALTMEYTIRPNLFLEMEYRYDSQLLSERREDKRLWIRHIFPF